MKRKLLSTLTVIVATVGLSMIATPGFSQVRLDNKDNHAIAKNEIRHDNKEIRHDRVDMRNDRGDLAHDKKEVMNDRRDIRGDKMDIYRDRKDLNKDRRYKMHNKRKLNKGKCVTRKNGRF